MPRAVSPDTIADRTIKGLAAAMVYAMALGIIPLAPQPVPVPLPDPYGPLIGGILTGGILATAATLSLLGRMPKWSALLGVMVVLSSAALEGRAAELLQLLARATTGDASAALQAVASLSTIAAALALIAALRLSAQFTTPTGKSNPVDDLAPSHSLTESVRAMPLPRSADSLAGGIQPRRVQLQNVDPAQRTARPQKIQPLGTHRSKQEQQRKANQPPIAPQRQIKTAVRSIRVEDGLTTITTLTPTAERTARPLVLTPAMSAENEDDLDRTWLSLVGDTNKDQDGQVAAAS